MKKLILFVFIFFSLFFLFASKIEAACVWNKIKYNCIGSCTYGTCTAISDGVCKCNCIASCYCAQFICPWESCSNGCGGSCSGTKSCAPTPRPPYCDYYHDNFCICGCVPSSSGGSCASCCVYDCPCGCNSSTSGGSCKSCGPTPTPTPAGPHCMENGLCSDSSKQSLLNPGTCGFNCPISEREYEVWCQTNSGPAYCGKTCVISSYCTTGGCLGGETPVPSVPPYCPSGSAYCESSQTGNNQCGGCVGSSCCSSCRRLVGSRFCYDQTYPLGHWTVECGDTDPTCGGSCGGGGTPDPGATPTPVPTAAPDNPTCTIAGPNSLTIGEDGTYRTISTSYSGGDANAEIMVNSAQSVTGSTRLGYSDCGGVAETCELNNVIFTPSAVGTYYVFCRGYNDGVKECRPFSPYDAPSTYDVDCDPDSTPDDPPAGSDFITVTVVQPGPWWQVKDSDVTASGGLTSVISTTCTLPGCNPFFNLEGDGGFPGVPMYSGTTNLTTSDVSSKGWLVNSTLVSNKTYDYAYFSRLIPSEVVFNEIDSSSIEGAVLSSTGIAYNGVYWFHYDGETSGLDLEITSDVALGNRKVVLMVEGGNLNVRGEVSLTDSSGFFIALVGKNSTGAKGGINIDPTVGGAADGVPELEGLYLADGAFHTGAGTTQLHVRGSVASLGGMYLERDLPDDGQTPAEYFEYAPDQIMLLPTKLQVKKYKWKEVAP